jgi:hypothetical protein
MKKTMTKYDFIQGLGGDFTRNGADALWDYYETLENDIGEEIEFDGVAIRCDWGEYDTVEEALADYSMASLEDLEDETTVIVLDGGGVLIQAY